MTIISSTIGLISNIVHYREMKMQGLHASMIGLLKNNSLVHQHTPQSTSDNSCGCQGHGRQLHCNARKQYSYKNNWLYQNTL